MPRVGERVLNGVTVVIGTILTRFDQCAHQRPRCGRRFKLVAACANSKVKPIEIRAVLNRNPVVADVPQVGDPGQAVGNTEGGNPLSESIQRFDRAG